MDFDMPLAASKLPLHRAKIESICRVGMGIPELAGMTIAGSVAIGIADEYSDLDFKLVSTDDGLAAVRARLDDVIAAGGRVIARFPADHLGMDDLTIVLYEDLVHADFYLVRMSQLWEKNEGMAARVLWERNGELTRELRKPHPGPPSPSRDVVWMEQRMWTWIWYTQSKILRGEVFEALAAIQELRADVLFPLLAETRETKVAGSRRVEALLKDLHADFLATASSATRADLMEALRTMARLYQTLADPMLAELGSNPSEARAVVIAALDAGLNWRPSLEPEG